jgi:hypothetical protein
VRLLAVLAGIVVAACFAYSLAAFLWDAVVEVLR